MDVAVTIPNERTYLDVARLVFGGAASRLDLGYEDVDDVQLALESILTAGLSRDAEITLELRVADGALSIWVGPLDGDALDARLNDEGRVLALDRLLGRLVDSATPSLRDDEPGILLVKRLPAR